jgi:hypothetical protein
MAAGEDEIGRASGYSVEDDADGRFRWAAFSPAGTRQGTADSRSEAEAAAQAAEQDLRRGDNPAAG